MVNERFRFHGRVEKWDDVNGLGEISLDGDDRRVWVHYAVIEPRGSADSYRTLGNSAPVEVEIERADQDGYEWRATWVRGVAT